MGRVDRSGRAGPGVAVEAGPRAAPGHVATLVAAVLAAVLPVMAPLPGPIVAAGASPRPGASRPEASPRAVVVWPPASSPPRAVASPPPATPGVSASRIPRARATLPPLEPLARLDPAIPGPALAREVVAYLPWWLVDGSFEGAPRWDPATDPWLTGGRLTDLVLFSVGIRRDGSLRLDEPGARFILGPDAERIIGAAHARGVRVLVSFTSGGYEHNGALFRDRDAIERFVREATALVTLRGLDGADLDVELIRQRRFVDWARTGALLRAALRVRDPRSRVTVATNGNRSGAMMAAMALAAGVDRAFLMGYAYRGPTSARVGSISPLRQADGLDLLDSLALYRARGVDVGRVVLGLPLYGLTWPTLGPEPYARRATSRALGTGRVTTIWRAMTRARPFGATTDVVADEPSARTTWWDAQAWTWWQTWFDTPATFRTRVVAAVEAGTAGIGLWALGHEGGIDGFASAVGEVLGGPAIGEVVLEPPVGRELDVVVRASTLDTLAPTRYVQLSNDGVHWSPPLPRARAARWRLADGPDGVRTVWARSRDAEGRESAPVAAVGIVDRTAPAVEGPVLVPVPGGWRVSFGLSDLTAITSARLRWRIGSGAWTAWRRIDDPADAHIPAADGVRLRIAIEVETVDPLGNRAVASSEHAVDDRAVVNRAVGDPAGPVSFGRASRTRGDGCAARPT
jgi:hypothetical protein